MASDLDNGRERNSNEVPKLDHGKLFGFRNLVPVAKPGSDMQKAAELAFNKRGDENGDPK